MRKLNFKGKYVPESVIRAITKMASTLLPKYGETKITCDQIMDNMDIGSTDREKLKEEVSGVVFKIMREGGGEIFIGRERFVRVSEGEDTNDSYTFKLHHTQKSGPSNYKD